ncbi:hypothetical protein [Methylorubrum aminovorans]
MPDSSQTVRELFKAKAVIDDEVNALVASALAGQINERAKIGDEYRVDVAAAVKASPFATSVLRDKTSMAGAKWNAARTAILLARVARER